MVVVLTAVTLACACRSCSQLLSTAYDKASGCCQVCPEHSMLSMQRSINRGGQGLREQLRDRLHVLRSKPTAAAAG